MNSENSRFIVAIALCMAFIFGWSHFITGPQLEAQKKALEAAEKERKKNEPSYNSITDGKANSSENLNKSSGGGEISESLKNKNKTIEEILNQGFENSERIKISTERLHGSINLKGATFDDLTLAEYKVENDSDSDEVTLFAPKESKNIFYSRTGFLGANTNIKTPDSETIWQVEGSLNELTSNKPLKLFWDNGEGVIFKKEISIDDKYMIRVNHIIENKTNNVISVIPYGLINRTKLELDNTYISHEGAISVSDEILYETSYSELQDEGEILYKSVSGWVGMTDKYWLSAIIPDNATTGKFDIREKYYRKNQTDRYQVDMMGEVFDIGAGKRLEYGINIFAGAKKLEFLEAYRDYLNIPLFERAIDFGILYFLTEPITKVLNYFYTLLGNFGLAILLLTVCIRLALFPLANKSYKSMARMRKHMPEIQKMKDRYKDDRQKQGMEMMKYYKDHKISPLSGCLPILVQIPVFFSLYKVLYVTIEMRHAPFYGWLTDLSAKDPTNLLNLFGLLPYAPPEWLPAIGILPLLFSITMVLQQKLNPPPTDETQKMVMAWLPWIFLFVFSAFASGLVLYWVWNNILSIIQQWIITRKIDEDKNE